MLPLSFWLCVAEQICFVCTFRWTFFRFTVALLCQVQQVALIQPRSYTIHIVFGCDTGLGTTNLYKKYYSTWCSIFGYYITYMTYVTCNSVAFLPALIKRHHSKDDSSKQPYRYWPLILAAYREDIGNLCNECAQQKPIDNRRFVLVIQ